MGRGRVCGHGAACRPQPGASPGPPWPPARPRADWQEWLLKAWAENLPPSGARAPERTAEIPAHPQLPSMVRCRNRSPQCGSEASVGPMVPAHKGSPSWGPEASCPGPASTSGLTSHGFSLTLGAWGVGQTPPLSVKPSEHHRVRLWGHPSGSNPQRHPSRGYSVTQLHRLYRGDSDSSTPRVTVQVSERGLQNACNPRPKARAAEQPPLPAQPAPTSASSLLWGVGTLPVSGLSSCRARGTLRSHHLFTACRIPEATSHWALYPLASQVAQW